MNLKGNNWKATNFEGDNLRQTHMSYRQTVNLGIRKPGCLDQQSFSFPTPEYKKCSPTPLVTVFVGPSRMMNKRRFGAYARTSRNRRNSHWFPASKPRDDTRRLNRQVKKIFFREFAQTQLARLGG